MKKIYFIVLVLLPVLFVSACASSNTGHQVATGDAAAQQASAGIDRGQIPPDFTITTIDGKKYRLSQFEEENKPVLLYFWASWCPFCSKDFDIVKNVYPKYADKAKFLAIDLDLSENAQLIQRYKEKKELNGIDFAVGVKDILSDYAIKYTTTKYAVGRNGLILYKGSGVFNEQQWEILFEGMISS